MTHPLKRHDRVRVDRGGWGVYSETGIVVHLAYDWAIVSLDGPDNRTWGGPPSLCTHYELDGVYRGPRIGAVVAMVAAARMALGGWSHDLPRHISEEYVHWDFVPYGMGHVFQAACGDIWLDDNVSADIDDVDCPSCLAIHARASGQVKP